MVHLKLREPQCRVATELGGYVMTLPYICARIRSLHTIPDAPYILYIVFRWVATHAVYVSILFTLLRECIV